LTLVVPEPETFSLINDCFGKAVGPLPHWVDGAGLVVVVVAPPPCLLGETSAAETSMGLGYANE
jgi:hypothetical protein